MDLMYKGKKKISYKKEAAAMKRKGLSKKVIAARLKKMKNGPRSKQG